VRDYVCVGVARPGAGRLRLSAYLGTQELSASGNKADTEELCSSPVHFGQKSHATVPLMVLQCGIFFLAYFFQFKSAIWIFIFLPLSIPKGQTFAVSHCANLHICEMKNKFFPGN
jgi:hypothetical protein